MAYSFNTYYEFVNVSTSRLMNLAGEHTGSKANNSHRLYGPGREKYLL